MSASVGTMRAGSNKHSGPKEKTKNERSTTSQQQQQSAGKGESQASKVLPTQEQIRLAEMMSSNKTEADPNTIKALIELTGKSEDVVAIALHDADNDADRAVNMLLEGGEQTHGEWRQGGKRKKKASSSQKETANNVNDDHHEGRNHKDKGDRDGDRERDGGSDRHDMSSRRGRRNGGPPPRLARGRGRDRGNFGDRDRERNNTEDWDNEKDDDKGPRGDRDRAGGDRGRSRGRGGFGGRRTGGSSRGGRFNNSNDRDNRSYNRVPRFEKMNNSQPMDGPEIDTWTNETAETKKPSKDTDWDNWNDTWVSEEDQWTGTLEETKVFTPSQMKIPDPEPVIAEPPSSLGQRLDVGSLFIESAKFSSKAPDYSKPSGDAYITQFNQAATESIKNTIGIGSSSRQPLSIPQQPSSSGLGLSSLAQQNSNQMQGSVSVLPSLQQSASQASSIGQAITQMSQIAQSASQAQAMSQIGMGNQQSQVNSNQPPVQSRFSSVMQQQQNLSSQTSMSSSMQQRPKPQRSKLPPPSKIPSSAVEMPGHIPRNPQLDLQFGIDLSSEPVATFGFGGSGDSVTVTSTYSTTSNGTSSVISNHLNQSLVTQPESNAGSISSMISSPQAGSGKGPSGIETQASSRPPGVFHNSVYPASPPKNEAQSLDREQNKLSDSIPFPPSQLERKSSPLSSQRTGQPNQNLSSGSLPPSKNDSSSSYSTANGYASSSYQPHQKASISQSQTFTHTTNPQAPQSSSFPGQYPTSQPTYPGSGQSQFSTPPSASQFPSSGQTPQYNNVQSQYSSGQSQYSSGSSSLPHQSQYSAGAQSSYGGSGQSQYSGYQNNSSFPSHPQSQSNFSSSSQTSGSSSTMYPATTQSGVSPYTSQSNSYQSPSAGSYHSRDSQAGVTATTQSSSGVSFPNQQQSSSLKPVSTQSSSSYSSQSFNANTTPLANKIGESLSKMTLKENTSIDVHQSSQFEHTPTSTSSVSASLSLPSATSTSSLSTGTSTISSTSTATSITSTSRIASMPSTCKAPPNLPPGVPLMGQYIMGQSTMPPFYSVPPVYGYEDVQLLQQRMPLQTGNYYDMGAFPTPAGSTLSTGREQQPAIPNVPFTGTSADSSKLPRVDAQSPNASSQQQNQAAQQPLFNFHYSYYYPSMFHGAAGLQYPMFPIPPGTNAGTTATTQFQKTYPSHVYTTKGYDELNQAQDFSKTGYGSSQSSGKTAGTRSGTSDIAPNAYSKSHTQGFDKQGFHGGTPPPFSLPLAPATQAGPMGATAPYGAPFLPVMAAHQAHSQMMHHPIQQDSSSSSSRGINQTGSQAKSGAAKSYAGPPYWNS